MLTCPCRSLAADENGSGERLSPAEGALDQEIADLSVARLGDARGIVSHRFELSEILKAYDTFKNAGKERALKVALRTASAGGGAH